MNKEEGVEIGLSILNANWCYIGDTLHQAEFAGVDFIHIDIMDGRFVKNITWGPKIIEDLSKESSLDLDVHLMIDNPECVLQNYIDAGPKRIAIHPASTVCPRRLLHQISNSGTEAGIALKLENTIAPLEYLIDSADYILLLTCDEGFGGNVFQRDIVSKKILDLRVMMERRSCYLPIQLDGGINLQTIRDGIVFGANRFVMGTALYNENSIEENLNKIRNAY